jgi:hypothetical protein
MNKNLSVYVILLLCLLFAGLLINHSLKFFNREGMENQEKHVVAAKDKRKIKTLSF